MPLLETERVECTEKSRIACLSRQHGLLLVWLSFSVLWVSLHEKIRSLILGINFQSSVILMLTCLPSSSLLLNYKMRDLEQSRCWTICIRYEQLTDITSFLVRAAQLHCQTVGNQQSTVCSQLFYCSLDFRELTAENSARIDITLISYYFTSDFNPLAIGSYEPFIFSS